METDPTICPDCGSDEIEVLKETPQNQTVRCSECSRVRSFSMRKSREIAVNTVISDGNQSYNVALPTEDDETIRVNDEFMLDGHRMLVTSIEVEGQQKPPSAKATEIRTLFAKLFDTVQLKLSINEGEKTRSFQMTVDPYQEIPVGLIVEFDGSMWIIKTLKSDQNRTLHKGFLFARNVRRAFCDPAPRRSKPGQVKSARTRGAPAVRKGEPASPRIKGPRGQRSPKRS